jgi:hypothetical protein
LDETAAAGYGDLIGRMWEVGWARGWYSRCVSGTKAAPFRTGRYVQLASQCTSKQTSDDDDIALPHQSYVLNPATDRDENSLSVRCAIFRSKLTEN